MNPVALKTAQKTGFPADHIIGNVWSNSEQDVIPDGDAAKGYIAVTTHPSGTDFPVVQAIVDKVYSAGKGNLENKNGASAGRASPLRAAPAALLGYAPLPDRPLG